VNKLLIAIGIVVALFLIVVLPIWTTYNGMVTSSNNIDKTWQDVQAAYQRRLDVIPRIAEVAKFSVDKQIELQKTYASLREGITNASTPTDIEKVNQQVSTFYLNARAEAVPTLNTTQLTELNSSIDNVERVINNERKVFNTAVLTYNNKVKTFPGNIVAGWFNFESKEGFTAQAGAENAPPLNLIK